MPSPQGVAASLMGKFRAELDHLSHQAIIGHLETSHISKDGFHDTHK